jgi:putative sterol carrier protein
MTAKEIIFDLQTKVNPAVIKGLETTFHFDLSKDGSGGYTVTLANDELCVEEGLIGDPKCVVTTSGEHFVSLINKESNPMMSLLTGKLKISNQGELIKYAKIFGLM